MVQQQKLNLVFNKKLSLFLLILHFRKERKMKNIYNKEKLKLKIKSHS